MTCVFSAVLSLFLFLGGAPAQAVVQGRGQTHASPPVDRQAEQSALLERARTLIQQKEYDEAISLLEDMLNDRHTVYASQRDKADFYRMLGNAYWHAGRTYEARRAQMFALTLYKALNVEPLARVGLLTELAETYGDLSAAAPAKHFVGNATQLYYLKQAVVVLADTASQAYLSKMAALTCQLADLYQNVWRRPDIAAPLKQTCLQAGSRQTVRNVGAQQQAILDVVAALPEVDIWKSDDDADPIVSKPAFTQTVAPVYPALARRLRQEGVVLVRAVVNHLGELTDVKVIVSSGHTQLDRSAINAVRQWQFTPALTKSGKPASSSFDLPLTFVLK